MYYFTAEFAGNIDSRALFEMLQCYQLNVTDLIYQVYVHGTIHDYELPNVIEICTKFGMQSFHYTKKSRK